LIALAAGTGGLEILRALYDRVIVPFEVVDELHAAGGDALGVAAFEKATWLESHCRSPGFETFGQHLGSGRSVGYPDGAERGHQPGLHRRDSRTPRCAHERPHADGFDRRIDQGSKARLCGFDSAGPGADARERHLVERRSSALCSSARKIIEKQPIDV